LQFVVPEGWERYHRQIKSSVDTLIRQKVISGISPSKLSAWWGNFSTKEEKYLAAQLLDSLVYRTEDMMRASCYQIIHKILPQRLNSIDIDYIDHSTFSGFLRSTQHELIFAPVTTNKPGKSGESLLRLFIRTTGLNKANVQYADKWKGFSAKTKAIILLDDMVGTGNQFCDFYAKNELENCPFPVIYIPIFAHKKGIKRINEYCPKVDLVPTEVLGEEHNFFREDKDSEGHGIWAKDKHNRVDDVKAYYANMLKRKKIEITDMFGFGSLGLTVYTSMSTPNNSLHIFYTSKNPDSWNQFLTR
jgi:hypothetical protein